MSETNVLRMENVTMQFGGVVALNDLSLDVPEGKITALSRFYAAALEGLTSQWLRDGMAEDLAPFLADLGELLDGNIRLSLERCVRKEN